MTLITALEIASNYPKNILIEAVENTVGNWTSLMYMTRDGEIHKLMLSFDGFCYESKEAAISAMENIAQSAINSINKPL